MTIVLSENMPFTDHKQENLLVSLKNNEYSFMKKTVKFVIIFSYWGNLKNGELNLSCKWNHFQCRGRKEFWPNIQNVDFKKLLTPVT